jgi:GH15 family glucan-1,4-alpha-glucosidase
MVRAARVPRLTKRPRASNISATTPVRRLAWPLRTRVMIRAAPPSIDRPGHPDEPDRVDGYLPIRSYAAIGDGRTVALVARDGAIDWLPLPEHDSASVFGAVLDAGRGGRFALAPESPYTVQRRYVPDTNVLETVFSTDGGKVRVIDAMTPTGAGALAPLRELTRYVEGVSGSVPMGWSVEPRFGYGAARTRIGWRAGVPVARAGGDALAVCAFGAGTPQVAAGVISGRFDVRQGSQALIATCFAHHEPLVVPTRDELRSRVDLAISMWQRWSDGLTYDGPWRDAVIRSALALKLLVHAPSGALAAAATTSLPEELAGERNWDYRFSWVRDSAFTLNALLALSCAPEARAYLWWLMHASQLTHPRLRVLYRLDGGPRAPERSLALEGYRRSRPVRVGNGAAAQQQLDVYGELLQTAWLYASTGHRLDADIGRRLAEIADLVCGIWREPDAGIWEVRSEQRHFTQSKMMCWIALDRAMDLAERGLIPDRHLERWRIEADAVRTYVETHCFSQHKQSYVRHADSSELDASLLLGILFAYGDPRSDRWVSTVDAVRRELGHGPFVTRYTGEDGLAGTEGAFLSCSFWLAEALARTGRLDAAIALMDELVALANDVGLYAEEIDPVSSAFLGNMPQGLSHLSLISAAMAIADETAR